MPITRRQTLKFGSAALAAMHPLASRAQAATPPIIASFSLLADMAQELAPAGAQVTALVGPDADAHV